MAASNPPPPHPPPPPPPPPPPTFFFPFCIALPKHPNLVQLLGFCETEEHVFLVYDFMAGGNLQKRLKAKPPLPWSDRIGIALGVARGLAYLHLAAARVHRDGMQRKND